MLELTKLQKNQIFEIIRQNDLDPARFKWGFLPSAWNTIRVGPDNLRMVEGYVPDNAETLYIRVDKKDFHFTFEQGLTTRFGANSRPRLDGMVSLASHTWEGLLSFFAQWISIIKYEISEPDLWTTSFVELDHSQAQNFNDEITFSLAESKQIKVLLEGIQRKLEALPDFGPDRTAKLEEAIVYLEKKLDEHVSKTDWKNIFVGTIFHIFLASWLAPFADQFKDVVMQAIAPYLTSLLRGLAIRG
jgi:hypothetical protein